MSVAIILCFCLQKKFTKNVFEPGNEKYALIGSNVPTGCGSVLFDNNWLTEGEIYC